MLLQPEAPLLTYSFYALVAWGLSALLVAFRILAVDEVRDGLFFRLGLLTWLVVPWYLAMNGYLIDLSMTPPALMRLVVAMELVVVVFCLSPWGRHVAEKLPTSLLVGTQVFRLPLEILLYKLAAAHFIPNEMTFAGYNFDIITGVLALPLWIFLHTAKVPQWIVWGWNCLGSALLLTIVTLAILSFPKPFGMFTPYSTLIAFHPWVWLPTFLVPIALASHLLLFRKLMLPKEEALPNI